MVIVHSNVSLPEGIVKKRGSTKPLKTRSSSQPAVGRCEKVLLVHVETQPLPSIVFKRFRETTHSKSSDRKVNRTCPGSKTSLNFSPISPQNTRGNNSHRESLATSLLAASTESDSWWPSGNSTSIAHWTNNLPIKLVIFHSYVNLLGGIVSTDPPSVPGQRLPKRINWYYDERDVCNKQTWVCCKRGQLICIRIRSYK